MAAPAPRCKHDRDNLSRPLGGGARGKLQGMAISKSGTKNTGCGSNDGTTLFEEQNGRSTRALDHAYLARNWKFGSIPLQRRVGELLVLGRRSPCIGSEPTRDAIETFDAIGFRRVPERHRRAGVRCFSRPRPAARGDGSDQFGFGVDGPVRRHIPQIELSRSTHSMTSSARRRTDCGIVRPSALAVLRLITSSNFVGCSTGISAGLAPCKILTT